MSVSVEWMHSQSFSPLDCLDELNNLQEDAAQAMSQFNPLMKVQCSQDIKLFLCTLFTPLCTPVLNQVTYQWGKRKEGKAHHIMSVARYLSSTYNLWKWGKGHLAVWQITKVLLLDAFRHIWVPLGNSISFYQPYLVSIQAATGF